MIFSVQRFSEKEKHRVRLHTHTTSLQHTTSHTTNKTGPRQEKHSHHLKNNTNLVPSRPIRRNNPRQSSGFTQQYRAFHRWQARHSRENTASKLVAKWHYIAV